MRPTLQIGYGGLRATGPVDAPLSPERAGQLGALGLQTGMRIGTARAFQTSRIQCSAEGLTGLANRRTVEEPLRELGTGQRPVAMVMCGLDHFKLPNDRHGHAAGDNALRLFAEVLRESLRESDVIGRWGSEEFAFVLPDADTQQAQELTNRVRKRLAQALQIGPAPRFSASFGIPDSTISRDIDPLIRMTDVALYHAKAQGRDRAGIADPAADLDDDFVREPRHDGAAVDLRALVAEG